MARGPTYRGSAGADLAVALTAWGTAVVATSPTIAGPAAGASETFNSDEEVSHAFVLTGSGELQMLPGAEGDES